MEENLNEYDKYSMVTKFKILILKYGVKFKPLNLFNDYPQIMSYKTKKRVLKVRYTMQRIYNKVEKNSTVIIDRPKSETSLRTIPLSTKLYNILQPLKKQYSKNSFFLTGSTEKFVEPRSYQRMFDKCMKDCKISDLHFHRASS